MPQRVADILRTWVIPAVLLVASAAAAISLGPVEVPLSSVVDIVLHRGGSTGQHAAVVWDVRAPRVVVGALVGGGLSAVGVVMQAVFRNPLADPGITGVSSGGAVGAVAVLVTGTSVLGSATLPIGAFLGAAITVVILLGISASGRDAFPLTLVLVGIALGAFCSAIVSVLVANAPEDSTVRSVVFWINGDLTARVWADVALCAGPILVGIAYVLLRRRVLDALLLGESTATSIGVDVRRERVLFLLFGALITGAAVAVSGVIAFVGLVVPHALRLIVGTRHDLLLPASIFCGAAFLVLADLGARTVFHPVVLQTGTLAALVGAPVFGYLILRKGTRPA